MESAIKLMFITFSVQYFNSGYQGQHGSERQPCVQPLALMT